MKRIVVWASIQYAAQVVCALTLSNTPHMMSGNNVTMLVADPKTDCCRHSETNMQKNAQEWWAFGCQFHSTSTHDYWAVFNNFKNQDSCNFHAAYHDGASGTDITATNPWDIHRSSSDDKYGTYVGLNCDNWVQGCAYGFDLQMCSGNPHK